jgi:hypothetical protein
VYRTLGAFVFGIAVAVGLFFYGRDIWDAIRYSWNQHERRLAGSDLVVALSQPFALVGSGNALNEDDVWDDSSGAVCEGAIAIENRSHHPLSVALDVRRRDGGTLTLMDGPDSMDIAPGTSAVRVLRDQHFLGDVSDEDCNALNAPGSLIVAIQACYDENRGGDCSEAEIDPAGDAARPRGPDSDRRDSDRQDRDRQDRDRADSYRGDSDRRDSDRRDDPALFNGGHGNVGGNGTPSY